MPPELSVLQHFHFLRPEWALLFIPWVAIQWIRHKQQSERELFGGIIAPHLLEHLRVGRFTSRWMNPRNFTLIVMALLLIVLMGPTWRQQPSPLSQDDAALVILLDVSTTMEQRDIQPSRLQRARQKISDLLALRPDKKAALVVYAGSAHTVLSLTADQQILNQYLAAITPGIMPRGGKFPEYALPRIDTVLSQTEAPASIVMFTDGAGADTQQAFDAYFSQRAHQLLVVGVGKEEPLEGIAPLERRTLEELAAASGGKYIAMSIDDSDVRRLDRQINSHYVIIDDNALPWLDSGYELIFPAMALFLMWFRRGWTLTWAWMVLPLLLSTTPAPALAQQQEPSRSQNHWFADLWLTGDQQGRLLMQLGRYQNAAERFEDPSWKGMAYYYAEEFMLAAEYFSRRDSDTALFNEAGARAHARDYMRAVQRYDRLLERSPQFPGAAANRQQVQALIDEINRLSESQQEEAGVSGEDKELGGDDAIPAMGADTLDFSQAEITQLTAEDILQDPAASEMWLRSVQQDPSNFLAIKFNMQLQQQEESP